MWQSSTLPQRARLPAGASGAPRQEMDWKKVEEVENALVVLNTELATKTREMVRRFHSEADRSERYGVEAVILKKAAICSDLGRPAPKAGQHLIELMSERRIPAIAHEAIADRCPAGVRGFDAIQRKVFQQYHRTKKIEAQNASKKSLPVISPQEKFQPPANLDLSLLLRQPLPLTTAPDDKDPEPEVRDLPPGGARTGTSGSDVLYGMPRFSPKHGQQSPDSAALDRLLEAPPPRLRSPLSRSGIVSLEESIPIKLMSTPSLLTGDLSDPMLEPVHAGGRGSRRDDGGVEGIDPAAEEDISFAMANTSFYQVTPKSRGRQGESRDGSPSRAGAGLDASGTLEKYRKGTPLNGTPMGGGMGTGTGLGVGGDWRSTSMQRDILVRSIHTVHGNREPVASTVTLTFSNATVNHLKSIGRLPQEASGNTFTVCRRPPTGQRPLLAPVPLHAMAHAGTQEGEETAYKPLSDIQRSRIELNFRRTNPEYCWLPPTPVTTPLNGKRESGGAEVVGLGSFQSPNTINPFFAKIPELLDEPASGLSRHLRPERGEGSTDVPQLSIRSYAAGDKPLPPVYLTQSEALMLLQPLGHSLEPEANPAHGETVDWDSHEPLPALRDESLPQQRPPLSGMPPRPGAVEDDLSTEADEAAGTYVSKEEEKARELAKAAILARRQKLEANKQDLLRKLNFERFPGVHRKSRTSSRSPSLSPNSRDGSNGRRGSPWRKKEFDPVAAGRADRRDRVMRRRTPPRLLSLAKPVERKTHTSLTTYEEFKVKEASRKLQTESESNMSRLVHLPVYLHIKGMV